LDDQSSLVSYALAGWCGTGIKRCCAVMEIRLMDSYKLLKSEVKVFVNPSRLKRKKVYFFPGRGVFSLEPPFNG